MPRVKSESYRYQQIADELVGVIQSQYHPGDMFASENMLAKEYSVTPVTIRRALDVLSQQGLIQRYHRRGTVVLDPVQQGEFAIVIRPQLLDAGSSPFFREMATLLSEKIREYNIRWSSKLHLGGKVDRGEDYPATLDILHREILKRVRGVFAFHNLREVAETLREKKVPVVELGERGQADVHVWMDRLMFYRKSVEHLGEVGCRTVGFFWNHMDRPLQTEERLDKVFSQCALAAGLRTKEAWMPAVLNDLTERKSYERFIEFWERGDHPEGMVIADDMMAHGILRGVLHKQIEVPRQIRLVAYANKGVEIPFHLPVTRFECAMEQMAVIAVEAMAKLVKGQKVDQDRIDVPGVLVKGQTT